MSCPRPSIRWALVAVVAAAALSACGGSGGDDQPAAATSAPAAAATTVAPTSGNGSAPEPTSTALADGRHPAYITKIDKAAGTIEIDVVQFFDGPGWEEKAKEDGLSKDAIDTSDWHIRNRNPLKRTFSVAPSAPVVVNNLASDLGLKTEPFEQTVTWERFSSIDLSKSIVDPMFWVTLKGGTVHKIEEQFDS